METGLHLFRVDRRNIPGQLCIQRPQHALVAVSPIRQLEIHHLAACVHALVGAPGSHHSHGVTAVELLQRTLYTTLDSAHVLARALALEAVEAGAIVLDCAAKMPVISVAARIVCGIVLGPRPTTVHTSCACQLSGPGKPVQTPHQAPLHRSFHLPAENKNCRRCNSMPACVCREIHSEKQRMHRAAEWQCPTATSRRSAWLRDAAALVTPSQFLPKLVAAAPFIHQHRLSDHF